MAASTAPAGIDPRVAALRRQGSWRSTRDRIALAALVAATLFSVLVTVGVVLALTGETVRFFGEVDPWAFLTGTEWSPLFAEPQFGVLPLVGGTLLVTAIALVVAVPGGLLVAAWLAEAAGPRARKVVKPALELLVGVPTVVLGYFALTFFTPTVLRDALGLDVLVFNALAAGIVVGVSVLPVVATIADDAMRAVPRGLREAAYALGAPRRTVTWRVVAPAALSGIAAAITLAGAKAIGETMIVAIAGGGVAQLGVDPREAYATMTAFIAQTGQGDVAVGSTAYRSIFAVGAVLFVMTLALNLAGAAAVRRFRQAYE